MQTNQTDPRPDIPLGYTRDSEGRELTYKDSTGYWREYTYDSAGRVLTFKNSDWYWHEYTYDSEGNVASFNEGHNHEH